MPRVANRIVEIYSDREALAQAAVERIVAIARDSITSAQRFTIALAGGDTPRRLYELLAMRGDIDWSRVHVFWGDERCVPPEHAESNYRMAREALLSHVPIATAHIHRIAGEADPAQAARDYEQTLRTYFTAERSFDLVLLGMGDDGHTASLFPGTPAVTEQQRWVMETVTGQRARITLTPVVLNAAASILVLVAGATKAARLAEALDSDGALPVHRIKPTHGTLTWLVDEAAAARLQRTS
jgi:6-phosphogluconolactonase